MYLLFYLFLRFCFKYLSREFFKKPFTMTYGQTIWALYNDLRTDYMDKQSTLNGTVILSHQ